MFLGESSSQVSRLSCLYRVSALASLFSYCWFDRPVLSPFAVFVNVLVDDGILSLVAKSFASMLVLASLFNK